MTRQAIGEALSTRLFAAETAIDHALAEAARLTAMLPTARAEAYLSATVGPKAFDGAAASIGALAEARSHLVRTHHALSALARALGLDSLAIGPIDKPEDTPPIGGQGRLGGEVGHEPVAVNKTLPMPSRSC